MKKLKIIEAMGNYTSRTGFKLTQIELAKSIWTESSSGSQTSNMSKLVKGKSARKFVLMINAICEKTGVDPNFLFGY